jgi:hypothetical protein
MGLPRVTGDDLRAKSSQQRVTPRNLQTYTRESPPEWRQAIASEIGSNGYEKLGYALILNSTRVAVGTQDIRLQAATSRRRLPGTGLTPTKHYYLYEFGADPKVVPIRGRRGNTYYDYKRKVNTGLPPRHKYGRGAYKAAGTIVTRSIALWVSSVIQIYNDAARGKAL